MSAFDVLDRPLNSAETQRAIEAILARLEQIEAVCGEGFPLYNDGAWKVSAGGSWLGGFWAGLWWLRAVHYGRQADRQQALRIAGRLRDKLDSDTHHRALIFWYGAGLGAQLLADPEAAELAQQAAQRLAHAFDPVLGCIPLGREMGGGAQGDRSLSIDPLAATLNLFALGNAPDLLSLGRQHLHTSFRACAGSAGAWSSHALDEQGQWHVGDPAGDWSRGQAWAMLGLGVGARLYGVPFHEDAQRASQYWLRSRSVHAPLNRLGQPDGPHDPCAAAMASLALQSQALELADGQVLQQEAGRLLAAIVRSDDFVDGRFNGHCYRTSATTEHKVESACGSFFLLAALMAWAGELDARLI
ncbi:glucuronyl hydrolase [Pseudomonas sp. Marseille-Q1929]|uniref:glucuronyl hydrolase n=1 Tax=Pseudomonas sp. Marseille-Q1929 TaxID=2730402 RepID=UPI001A8D2E36|nr:glucuronyl hydrolase [Pseudomonas sp. Marseille-Q1929]MBO0492832.1 glucuronyl hydrolase [Pseudomonas sp. Marseille-Q1929]